MASQREREAMTHAISVAADTVRTLPNPRVGCAILDPHHHDVIAVGVHRGAGTAHAEVEALSQAAGRAQGATAVVTLEPCQHTGRTGPCTQALIEAGIARVVFGQHDPNANAAGGEQALRRAGIDVETGVLVAEARALNPEWTFAMSHGRPHVTWKYAATLDGFSAAADGTSRWISGPESRQDSHRRRAEADAIVVGSGTVAIDNPELTARVDGVPIPFESQPMRVVVGERDLPAESSVFNADARTMQIRSNDPQAVLAELAEAQIRGVWLEGGPSLAGAFLDAGVIDRVIGYLAPAVLGAGLPAVVTAAETLTDLRSIHIEEVSRTGQDVRLIGSFTAREDL